MESVIFSIVLGVIFLLLVALLVFLYLHLTRQLRDTTSIALELIRASQTANSQLLLTMRETLADTTSELVDRTAETLKEVTTQSIRMMDLATTRSTAGSQALATQMQETIRSQSAMLGTKDTLAYHQVQGAPPLLTDADEPYPAVDDMLTADLKRQQLADLDAAAAMLAGLGVVQDGSTGSPVAYPAAAGS